MLFGLCSAFHYIFTRKNLTRTVNLHRLSIQVTKSPRNDQIAMVFLDLLVFFHILTRNLSVDCINLEKSRVSEYIKINCYNFPHVCSSIAQHSHSKSQKLTLFKRCSIEINGPLVSTMRNAFMAWFC